MLTPPFLYNAMLADAIVLGICLFFTLGRF